MECVKYFVSWEDLSKESLIDLFKVLMKNGSIFGYAGEFIAKDAMDLKLNQSKSEKGYDGISEEFGKVEVKTLSSYGLKLGSSSMYGKGRSYDQEVHKNYVESLGAYAIVERVCEDTLDFCVTVIPTNHPNIEKTFKPNVTAKQFKEWF